LVAALFIALNVVFIYAVPLETIKQQAMKGDVDDAPLCSLSIGDDCSAVPQCSQTVDVRQPGAFDWTGLGLRSSRKQKRSVPEHTSTSQRSFASNRVNANRRIDGNELDMD
jgi:hypothetical protein